ncbi:MYND-type domain-containing protein, partial [Favolaschia claudopus]
TYAICILSRFARHPLTLAFLEQNACWVVTRMLVLTADVVVLRTAKASVVVDRDSEYIESLNAGFSFIRFALIRDFSPRWVAQSVDAGLLRAVCRLAPLLEKQLHQFGRECVRHIIADTLPKHLVYLSVVKVVDREMNDIDDATLEKGVDGSWLAADWRSLQEVLTLRRSVAKISKEDKGSSRTLCDSKKARFMKNELYHPCGKMAPKKELQRCGGCLNVFYCSKQCQKEAWPNHRALCRLRTEDRATQTTEDRNALFPKADAQFFRELLSTDAGLHLGHMQNLAKREFPREKQGEYFALCLDYTDLRYPTGTCSLKDIRTYTAPPMNGEDEDEEVVVEHNKEMVRMVLRDPKAYTFIEATFAWGERRMSRNFMIRPNIWDKHVPQMVNFLGKKMCANEDVEENTPGFMKHLMNLGL